MPQKYSIGKEIAGVILISMFTPALYAQSKKTQKQNKSDTSIQQVFKSLNNIVISSQRTIKPVNEFATVSARSFSMEDNRRYPAAFSDPARMATNFPGVMAADDGGNSIIVRGNSPRGVLWKLEGIEIPTPSHFSSLGNSGGGVSMLSGNVVGRSDFYTGAFPAEIGNATSAAFDLNFRNGNKTRKEHSFMLGTLGAEVSTEGPWNKKQRGSYLVNYRYSTLALLKNVIDMQGQTPDYQDLSFKLNWQTKSAGEFTLFGLGGYNKYSREAKKDKTEWKDDERNISFTGDGKLGVIGLSHQYNLSSCAYIKTVLSASYQSSGEHSDTLNPDNHYSPVPVGKQSFADKALRLSIYYNNKLNTRHTIRTGIIVQQWNYDLNYRYYDDNEHQWKQVLQGDGQTQFYQAYLQWKYNITNRLVLNTGLNASYLALTKKHSIEPRASIAYTAGSHVFSIAAGLHSRPEHISTYLFENKNDVTAPAYPNKKLDLSKAFHVVAGYERFFVASNIRAKAELYYQHLYDIPVEIKAQGGLSVLNMESAYELINTNPLANKGKGTNYGIDLSVEKAFSNNYYFTVAGSVFKSTFTNYSGEKYNSRYDRNYSLNFIGGKEWVSRRNSNALWGLSGKLLSTGGLRHAVIDIPASVAAGKEEWVKGTDFSQQGPAYFRMDASVYWKKNRKRSTHILALEIQNLTGRENFYSYYFDKRSGEQKIARQIGIIPNISYKIQIHQ